MTAKSGKLLEQSSRPETRDGSVPKIMLSQDFELRNELAKIRWGSELNELEESFGPFSVNCKLSW